MGWRMGIDLGGTKIEGILLDAAGRGVARLRVATPVSRYEAIVEAIVGLVASLASRAPDADYTLGIGAPGSLSPRSGLVRNSNTAVLNGRNLRHDLQTILGRPVPIANDANCFALSEASDGSGAGAASVFGVILGTGVGGGLVQDGKLLIGHNGLAGEWGHNPLPWTTPEELAVGQRCFCGKMGCLETWLSGPGVLADHARHTGTQLGRVEELLALAASDPRVEQTLQRLERRLARSLAAVINFYDPEVIVLGGGLSNLARLYRAVPDLWLEWVFAEEIATRLVPPTHGDSSGVRGAAWLPG